jgi:2-dehydro-3-deoxyphosphogluconate aldolase/(4S)-4-hydroxy-2-oxoglutarate aldolase
VIEVTLNSKAALQTISRLAKKSRLLVGAGTVLSPEEVHAAADSGVRFILSPNRNVNVIAETKRHGLSSFPGCLSCSEIVEAFEAGADAVKIFPAQMAPPPVLKALRAPLGDIRTIPTGGIYPGIIPEFLSAGAWAFGVGSELVNASVKEAGGMRKLQERAQQFAGAVQLHNRK